MKYKPLFSNRKFFSLIASTPPFPSHCGYKKKKKKKTLFMLAFQQAASETAGPPVRSADTSQVVLVQGAGAALSVDMYV